MEEVKKIFQIDVGRETRKDEKGNEKPFYHAHFISVADMKVSSRAEETLSGLMQYASRLLRKKEKENLFI